MNDFEFRVASLEERKEFYEREFDLKKVKEWFRENKVNSPTIVAIDAGSDSGIISNKKLKGIMLYFPFSELNKKIKKYAPEDIYYDRNFYENFGEALRKLNFKNWKKQELVFDIDADNISCECKKLCNKCLRKSFLCCLEMKKILNKKFNFRKIKLVYSGEGFHIHVFDEKAFLLNLKERKDLTNKFKKFPIDPWVSQGNISLIRLPYSLNTLVSRITIPLALNKRNFSFFEKYSIPEFLKD